jgi:hypothetical protein
MRFEAEALKPRPDQTVPAISSRDCSPQPFWALPMNTERAHGGHTEKHLLWVSRGPILTEAAMSTISCTLLSTVRLACNRYEQAVYHDPTRGSVAPLAWAISGCHCNGSSLSTDCPCFLQFRFCDPSPLRADIRLDRYFYYSTYGNVYCNVYVCA